MNYRTIILLGVAFTLLGVGIGMTLKPLFAADIVQNPVASVTYTVNPTGSVIYRWSHNSHGEIEYVTIYDAKTTRYRKIKLTKTY